MWPTKQRSAQAQRDEDLCFKETVQNRALPPCDLNSFMDYLFYVERRAENLQFFLWYCDYVKRWSRLLPRQRRLSPAWGPAEAVQAAQEDAATAAAVAAVAAMSAGSGRERSRSLPAYAATASAHRRPTASIHRRSDSEKLEHILTLLEEEDAARHPLALSLEESRPISSDGHCCLGLCCLDFSTELSTVPNNNNTTWLPFTIQPFRDELARVVRHYLVATGPRALPDLFAPERTACLRAARHTTHPSALLPAFLAAESVLRSQSFSAFARRWCVANTYGRRLAVAVALAVAAVLVGGLLDAALIWVDSSGSATAPPISRLVCAVLWWPALTALLAARHGIDVVLYARRQRQLRPWEATIEGEERDVEKPHCHQKSVFSTDSAAPSFRNRTLGPRNDPDAEPWAVRAALRRQAPLHRRVAASLFPAPGAALAVAVQNPRVRARQTRIVRAAVLWAGLATAAMTVASIFIPSPRR